MTIWTIRGSDLKQARAECPDCHRIQYFEKTNAFDRSGLPIIVWRHCGIGPFPEIVETWPDSIAKLWAARSS